MQITFLGTGTSQGIPIIGSKHPVCLSKDPKDKRLRVSIVVKDGDNTLVVDCGPDFRQQMLTSGTTHMDALLFTHEHADHTAGLDDIRPFFFRQGDIPIYAHQRVIEQLQIRFAYIFERENKYPGAPNVEVNEVVNNTPFSIGNINIQPINLNHGKLQVFGYRFNDFAYLTDVKSVPVEELKKLQGLDVLVVSALREEEHYSHFNLREALDFVDLVKPGQTYFTHISHLLGFHEEVEKNLPPHVNLAYDGLTIEL
ncbi:MAG: MBL fold metallo-hydrolase [Cytophagaceae bacterium]|nr:MBL fold metallo-hydrolase [Cytophagaceae bacterium]